MSRSRSHNHIVQFYDRDQSLLAENVSRYLAEGLRQGGGAIVIATPAHEENFSLALSGCGVNSAAARREGRLVFCDAETTLGAFMSGGMPLRDCFENMVGPRIESIRSRTSGSLRAYGEMVNLLWNSGNPKAASRLEQFWNQLMASSDFSLMCAYQIDIFGREFQPGAIDEVLRSHTHVQPDSVNSGLERAVSRGVEEVLGSRAERMLGSIDPGLQPSWAMIPKAEANILWIRSNLPDYADEILARARRYYRDSFPDERMPVN